MMIFGHSFIFDFSLLPMGQMKGLNVLQICYFDKHFLETFLYYNFFKCLAYSEKEIKKIICF